jgi:tRNA(His) 5'-end guanylyltransferase
VNTRALERLLSESPRALDARYRPREVICEPVRAPFAVRLDGVSFGKRLRDFEAPRSAFVHAALVGAARALASTYGAEIVHVVSDEINLVFLASAPYGGRAAKVVSVLAAHASAELTAKLGRPLYFDGRALMLDDACDAAKYLIYRARVGLNNYVVKLARMSGLVSSRTPRLAELLGRVKIEREDLAWGTFIVKESGYREHTDICALVARFCGSC